ncbi:MAG: TolC family protein [bacterium]
MDSHKILQIVFICLLFVGKGGTQEILSLENSISIALKNNKSLQLSQKRIEQAKARLKEARASCLPILKLDSSYTRLDEAPTMGSMKIGDEDMYEIKTSFQQPIFTGGKIKAANKIARDSISVSEYEYNACRADVMLKVKTAYFSLLKLKKLLEVSKESLKQVEAHLNVVKSFYDAGMTTKVDVLKAEVSLSNAEQGVIKSENAVKLQEASFNSLLGRDMDTPVEIVDVFQIEPFDIELKACLNSAYQNRDDLLAVKKEVEIGKENIAIAKADYYPNIALFSNYSYQKGQSYKTDWEGSWVAGILVNITLWDWGATKAKIDQAKEVLEQIKDNVEILKDGIAIEVKSAYLSLQEAEKTIKVAENQVSQAEEAFRMEKERYKEGICTSTDVLDAQVLLTQAKTNYYQSLYDYHLAMAKLQKATYRI